MVPLHVQLINSNLRRVIKRLHFPLEVMLVCVRWYAAYPLSLRNLEEMMAERGVLVDHATVHRWALKMLPVLASTFRRRKLPVGTSWRVDETYVLVGGQWKYLYRAVDKLGQTVDFLLTAHRDVAAARRFFERAINLHDVPEKITIDKSGANTAAVRALVADSGVDIELRQCKYLNNIVEQDHRAIKRRTRPMMGFKSFRSAVKIIGGIQPMHSARRGSLAAPVAWPFRQPTSSTASPPNSPRRRRLLATRPHYCDRTSSCPSPSPQPMTATTIKTFGALLLLCATLTPCRAHAQDDALRAKLDAARAKAATQWVELETLRRTARVFLSTTGEPDSRGLVPVLQRVDMAETSPTGVATEVRRVDLNCERGEETLLGVRGFDAEGRELMARANKQPKPVLIANFHSATLRLVCSGDYLLPLVPGLAEARAHEAQAAKAERLSKVGDRAIPVTR